jgi:DNA-binding CsgD family transcriptional regulator
MRAADDSHALIELAQAAPERRGFAKEVLGLLHQRIGFSAGFFLGIGAPDADFAVGSLGPGYLRRLQVGLAKYQREIAPVKAWALSHDGVAVDTDVLGPAAQGTRYYDDLVRPAGGGHSLLCFLGLRGRAQGLLMLGREPGRRFRDRDLARLRGLRPALALGLASFAAPTATPTTLASLAWLTARERAIADYLVLGFTNREIALALGTSPHTVRNQLASLFRKAEVTTRAEMVGRLLGR